MMKTNIIPLKTWNHLGVNGCDCPTFAKTNKEFIQSIESSKAFNNVPFELNERADEYLANYVNENKNASVFITEDGENTIRIKADILDDNLASKINILAKENSNLTIYYIVNGEKKDNAYFSTIMNIKAEAYASVKLIFVELMKKDANTWSNIMIEQAENSNIDITRILIGAKLTISAIHSNLNDFNANLRVNTFFEKGQDQVIDINDIAKHYGKSTHSDMFCDGMLDHNAHKIYRGTIDFITGSESSKGKVIDNVLLLSNNIINKTCPLILCTEENVEGEHGASIGRFNLEHLFYLTSRGLTIAQAKALLIKARIYFVLNNIEDEELRNLIYTYTKGELDNV